MSQVYDSSSIIVLEGLEPVRQRPGMYIGSTDVRGLHHLITEVVDNAIDEALADHCHHITIKLCADGRVECYDDGRGIPVDIHPKTGRSTVETVFTVLHAGGKFEKSAYKISGGLHGVGASVVNALSEKLEVYVHKDGKLHFMEFSRGKALGELRIVGDSNLSGTTVRFLADPLIFETTKYNAHQVFTKYRQTAYLTPGTTFTVIDEANNKKERYYFEGGIGTWIKAMTEDQKTVITPVRLGNESDQLATDIAFNYIDSTSSNILSFVNNINTPDGGTHLNGFKDGLLRVINEIAKAKGQIDGKVGEFVASDISDGLYAIVTVKVPNPEFEGQTKGRLGNSYIRKEVEALTYEGLSKYFNENEPEFMRLMEKIQLSAKARMAAKLARETVLRKSPLTAGVLPGKLTDCNSKNRMNAELFIVEGDSAGGSAKQGRDAHFQAILPLRGKILNTERATIQSILANNEVKALITSIGIGIKDGIDMSKLRYGKIIIMTDADVDGAHIRTLLLTFFYRYMRPLLDEGHVYIAMPPLYKISAGKKEVYIYDPGEKTLEELATENGFEGKYEFQRYKGLGEMNYDQLADTTMNPESRSIKKVNIEDAEEADKLFRILMGEDTDSRKHFILSHAKNVRELDV
ncbi:MAG: DNA gyrase subunit B [Candidatus Absconditabacterales bacterium]